MCLIVFCISYISDAVIQKFDPEEKTKLEDIFNQSVTNQHKMADKLRPDELAAFKAAFDMFDKNQDGTISTKVSDSLY